MQCLSELKSVTDVNYFVQQSCVYCYLLSVNPRGCLMHFMMVCLVHDNFMSVKVSELDVHSDVESCSELPSVIAFSTIANYTLVGKCVLLILLRHSNVKMSHWTKCCNPCISLQVAVLILSHLQRIYYAYIRVYVCIKFYICMLYIIVFTKIILTGVD